jgi:hypothetical protein
VFGFDGGPAAKSLKPKFNLSIEQASASNGMAVPRIEVRWIYFWLLLLCSSPYFLLKNPF